MRNGFEQKQKCSAPQIYARAMSVDEYDTRISNRKIRHNAEWILCNGETSPSSYGEELMPSEEALPGTHSLRFLKTEWVDPRFRRCGGDVFQIIVAVRSMIGEFEKRPRVCPTRYVNKEDIPLDRVKIIYDPDGVIHGSRIELDVGDPMANAREFEKI